LTFDPNHKYTDRELMQLAVQVAEQSRHEEDGRVHPLVGAVIARNGYVLATGFRGELQSGTHAEQAALSKLKAAQAMGCTVYSTLEPCTVRKEMACAQRLITSQVSQVFVGTLDPNPDIRGQGEWLLETSRIAVGKFDSDLVAQIKGQNREFINYMLGIGVKISTPENGATVGRGPIRVRGTYRVHPRPGDHIAVFGRCDFTYYPQGPIIWSRENCTWECPEVWLTPHHNPKNCGIVVARVNEDLLVWLHSYARVHAITQCWIGAEMPSPPPGFEILASVSFAC
jgi:pyrimidine deaminase RibD-like protein